MTDNKKTNRGKPEIAAFLNGAETSPEKTKEKVISSKTNEKRENKTIRIRSSFIEVLKDQVYERSKIAGRRITESDIIDEALEQYFGSL